MSVDWETLQLPAGLKASVKDLWSRSIKANIKDSYSANVPSHSVVMVRTTPTT